DRLRALGRQRHPGRYRPTRAGMTTGSVSAADRTGPTGEGTPLLEVAGLSIAFGTGDGAVRPVRDVSFSLWPGESLAVLGESGSGKTVASRAIMDLLAPSGRVVAGSVRLEGREVPLRRTGDAAAARRRRPGV